MVEDCQNPRRYLGQTWKAPDGSHCFPFIACLSESWSLARLKTEGAGAGGPLLIQCHLKEMPHILPLGALKLRSALGTGQQSITEQKTRKLFPYSFRILRPTLLKFKMLTINAIRTVLIQLQ